MALAWLCLALAQHFPSQSQSQQQARPGQSQWLKPGLEQIFFAQQFLRFWGPDEFLGGARSGHDLTGLAWLGKSQARSQGQGSGEVVYQLTSLCSEPTVEQARSKKTQPIKVFLRKILGGTLDVLRTSPPSLSSWSTAPAHGCMLWHAANMPGLRLNRRGSNAASMAKPWASEQSEP
ncbi:hypothetical protein DFH09DRAFT_1273331 [Mycena vulgaris]|nr:hypothetical protein DFH09DRAFT_1273331 [Mycena vulgaris]